MRPERTRRGRWIVAAVALALAGTAASVAAQQPAPDKPMAIGTGFVVSSDGAVITTAHGVDRCRSVSVTRSQAATVPASDIKLERSLDLALLRAKLPNPIRPLSLRTDPTPHLGEPVYLLGYPLQHRIQPGQPSFYATVVSGIGGMRGDPQVFRIQEPVLPGMSGAAVLDSRGRVIGVVKTHLIETLRHGGPTLGGQSFAILASNVVKLDLERLEVPDTKAEPMSSVDIAKRALASTVLISCERGE